MKLETTIYILRFVFNPQGLEFANLGFIAVCDRLTRADFIAADNPQSKSRADYRIEPAAAHAFFRRCQDALREAAEKRKAAQDRGDEPWSYSQLLAGADKALSDPPFAVAPGVTIGTEILPQPGQADVDQATIEATYPKLIESAIQAFLAPKIFKQKSSGLIIPKPGMFNRGKETIQ